MLPEHKTVGAWHCGKRLDPPESALQVWRLSCVSLRSYILVNSTSVFINVFLFFFYVFFLYNILCQCAKDIQVALANTEYTL